MSLERGGRGDSFLALHGQLARHVSMNTGYVVCPECKTLNSCCHYNDHIITKHKAHPLSSITVMLMHMLCTLQEHILLSQNH